MDNHRYYVRVSTTWDADLLDYYLDSPLINENKDFKFSSQGVTGWIYNYFRHNNRDALLEELIDSIKLESDGSLVINRHEGLRFQFWVLQKDKILPFSRISTAPLRIYPLSANGRVRGILVFILENDRQGAEQWFREIQSAEEAKVAEILKTSREQFHAQIRSLRNIVDTGFIGCIQSSRRHGQRCEMPEVTGEKFFTLRTALQLTPEFLKYKPVGAQALHQNIHVDQIYKNQSMYVGYIKFIRIFSRLEQLTDDRNGAQKVEYTEPPPIQVTYQDFCTQLETYRRFIQDGINRFKSNDKEKTADYEPWDRKYGRYFDVDLTQPVNAARFIEIAISLNEIEALQSATRADLLAYQNILPSRCDVRLHRTKYLIPRANIFRYFPRGQVDKVDHEGYYGLITPDHDFLSNLDDTISLTTYSKNIYRQWKHNQPIRTGVVSAFADSRIDLLRREMAAGTMLNPNRFCRQIYNIFGVEHVGLLLARDGHNSLDHNQEIQYFVAGHCGLPDRLFSKNKNYNPDLPSASMSIERHDKDCPISNCFVHGKVIYLEKRPGSDSEFDSYENLSLENPTTIKKIASDTLRHNYNMASVFNPGHWDGSSLESRRDYPTIFSVLLIPVRLEGELIGVLRLINPYTYLGFTESLELLKLRSGEDLQRAADLAKLSAEKIQDLSIKLVGAPLQSIQNIIQELAISDDKLKRKLFRIFLFHAYNPYRILWPLRYIEDAAQDRLTQVQRELQNLVDSPDCQKLFKAFIDSEIEKSTKLLSPANPNGLKSVKPWGPEFHLANLELSKVRNEIREKLIVPDFESLTNDLLILTKTFFVSWAAISCCQVFFDKVYRSGRYLFRHGLSSDSSLAFDAALLFSGFEFSPAGSGGNAVDKMFRTTFDANLPCTFNIGPGEEIRNKLGVGKVALVPLRGHNPHFKDIIGFLVVGSRHGFSENHLKNLEAFSLRFGAKLDAFIDLYYERLAWVLNDMALIHDSSLEALLSRNGFKLDRDYTQHLDRYNISRINASRQVQKMRGWLQRRYFNNTDWFSEIIFFTELLNTRFDHAKLPKVEVRSRAFYGILLHNIIKNLAIHAGDRIKVFFDSAKSELVIENNLREISGEPNDSEKESRRPKLGLKIMELCQQIISSLSNDLLDQQVYEGLRGENGYTQKLRFVSESYGVR